MDDTDELLIDDDDFMRDEWNQKYDPIANIESIKAMYSNFIFTGPSVMYNKEAEMASAMAENGLLTNNITEIDEAPWAGALLGEDCDWDFAANANIKLLGMRAPKLRDLIRLAG